MTVDEIFSSESEHLYFRLIAARNALNAANDPETVQVLNDILDETLNNISRIGTDEEIAAAEEIVVRKSNKSVKEFLSCRQFAFIAMIVMAATAAIGVLSLVIILIGTDFSKGFPIKAIITVVLLAGGVIAMAVFVSSYMKKKMEAARGSLKGKTVIGCNIDTGSGPKIKESSSRERESSSGRSESKASTHSSKAKKNNGTRVVHNYWGVVKVVLILAVIGTAGFLIYANWSKIKDSAQEIMFNVGIYDPAEKYSSEKYNAVMEQLRNVRKDVFYNEARRLFDEADAASDYSKYQDAAAVYEKCAGYKDSNDMRIASLNYWYYYQAMEDVKTSMKKALVDVKQIITPFNDPESRIDGFVNPETLKKEYSSHVEEYRGVYENGRESFNLQDFAKDGSVLYIIEERMNKKLTLTKFTIDEESGIENPEEYKYKLVEKSGENGITWYIAKDHVLKVTAEEMIKLDKY